MDRLIRKRAARRAQVTKLATEVTSLRGDQTATTASLKGLLARLQANDKELRDANAEIEPLIEEEHLDAEYETVIGYEEQLANAIAEVQSRLDELQLSQRDSSATPSVQASQSPSAMLHAQNGIKLPKLQLRTFTGELTDWLPFWQQFSTAVDENSRLTKREKFQYLSTLLKGDAASAIRGLHATESSYDDAIEMLKQRFGDTGRIEREHLAKLRKLPAVKLAADISGLRLLYDHVQANMRGLRALGVSSTSYASMMVDILLSALPTELVVEYQRMARYGTPAVEAHGSTQDSATLPQYTSVTEDRRDLGELAKVLNFVRVEIESREQAGVKEHPDRRLEPRTQFKRKGVPTGAVLHAGLEVAKLCVFCGARDHDTAVCQADVPLAEKLKKLTKGTRCFRCTKKGHRSRDCRGKMTCRHCGKRHASSVCDPSKQVVPKAVSEKVTAASVTTANGTPSHKATEVLLQTFRTWASSDSKCVYMRGIIDGGSQRTFIRDDIARKLNLPVVGETVLQLNTFANDTKRRNTRKGTIVEVRLRSQYGPKEYVICATTIDFICQDLPSTPSDHNFVDSLRSQGEFIADEILFPDVRGESGVGLLVGCDELWKLVNGPVKRCGTNEKLVAVQTVFGWTFQGPSSVTGYYTEKSTTAVCVLRAGLSSPPTEDTLERFWDLESLGISDESNSKLDHDASVLEKFEQGLQRRDGRYEVALPWKTGLRELEDNYAVAKTRLQSLVRQLERTGNMLEYDEAIRNYLKNGHAEKVTAEDSCPNVEYYMPHRAVIRTNSSTTRIRVVFDASSHSVGSSSLNDHLEKGPKLNADLVGVLLRFRLHKVAITADIEKAFLQVAIQSQDRDALRFLWFSEAPIPDNQHPQLECWRMTRVPFGTTASPFLLGATLQHHLKSFSDTDEELANSLLKSFYVDDLLTGASTIQGALEIVYKTQEMLRQAGMKLTKWASNAPEVQKIFERNDVHCDSAKKTFHEPAESKVLGVVWNRGIDEFSFSGEHLISVITGMRETKRSVLQASARIYDPLGFLSPYTVRVKILFQELWKANLDWDVALPTDIANKWRLWCSELPQLCCIKLERCLLPSTGTNYEHELHVFTDASPQAYGACVFLRTENEAGQTKVGLVFAKSRVAPLKILTLPRLELMGCVIGVRIAKFVKSALGLTADVNFWTDSTIALAWIRGDAARWKPFVRNRVVEIQDSSQVVNWRHCPGSDNPADALTRGLTVQKLTDEKQWLEGPRWLAHTEEQWPTATQGDTDSFTEVEDERRKEIVLATLIGTEPTPAPFLLSRYSSYQRVLRISAWIRRFVLNSRSALRTTGPLTAAETEEAEMYWIRQAQRESFSEEVTALKQNRTIATTSKIAQLRPFLDESGVMRVTGRLQFASEPEEAKHPIILARQHTLSALLVDSVHRRILHGGIQSTLIALRERWWITQARQLVTSTLHRCKVCARFRATKGTAPTAPLPAERTTPTHPFDVTGVDFAGPLYIKGPSDSSTKAYIALFTCATSRAVHLELVLDLTTKSFIAAFRRFISRRGAPSIMYSDNALTFKKASRDIANVWNVIRSRETQDFTATHRIRWRFIVERAAWWGGIWERMVRTVKGCLKRVIGRQRLTADEMVTLLHEVEAVVNSRPLTFIHSDPEEPSALTPGHLLIGRNLTALPEVRVAASPHHQKASDVNKRWIYRQRLADMFWRRWRKEYLLELRSAHQSKPDKTSIVSKGDIVIVHEDKLPRHLWTLARITELYRGRDGHVRSCELRLPSGRVIRRPVQLVYPLETCEK